MISEKGRYTLMRSIIVIAGIMLISFQAEATVNILPDCNLSTVKNAINLAANNDSIICPAGTWTWDGSGTNNYPIAISKPLILKGGYGGTTTINHPIDDGCGGSIWCGSGSPGDGYLIRVNAGVNDYVEISGFTFTGYAYGDRGMIAVGSGKRTRITKNVFSPNNAGGGIIYVTGTSLGVIDNNTFNLNNNQGTTIKTSTDTWGDASFKSDVPWGTNYVWYIENNTYYDPGTGAPKATVDCYSGSGYVFRHNTVVNSYTITHGFGSSGRPRACRSFEIYKNTYIREATATYHAWFGWFPGGTGVIHDNKYVGNNRETNAFQLVTRRLPGGEGFNYGACDSIPDFVCSLNDYKYCTNSSGRPDDTLCGVGEGTCTKGPLDNYPSGIGPPCRDQVGFGKDTGFGTSAQALEPVYEWNNTLTTMAGTKASIGDGIIVGTHYKPDTVKPGYSEYIYPHPLTSTSAPTLTPKIPNFPVPRI